MVSSRPSVAPVTTDIVTSLIFRSIEVTSSVVRFDAGTAA